MLNEINMLLRMFLNNFIEKFYQTLRSIVALSREFKIQIRCWFYFYFDCSRDKQLLFPPVGMKFLTVQRFPQAPTLLYAHPQRSLESRRIQRRACSDYFQRIRKTFEHSKRDSLLWCGISVGTWWDWPAPRRRVRKQRSRFGRRSRSAFRCWKSRKAHKSAEVESRDGADYTINKDAYSHVYRIIAILTSVYLSEIQSIRLAPAGRLCLGRTERTTSPGKPASDIGIRLR